jgi:hypothetical protein
MAGEAGGDHGIEDGTRLRKAGAAHEAEIVIGAVEDEELAGEDLKEGLEIEAGERVDEDVALIERNLDETEFLEIAMEAVGFCIHCDGIEAVES